MTQRPRMTPKERELKRIAVIGNSREARARFVEWVSRIVDGKAASSRGMFLPTRCRMRTAIT